MFTATILVNFWGGHIMSHMCTAFPAYSLPPPPPPTTSLPPSLPPSSCGSGLSGEALTEAGYCWVGVDISTHMLGQLYYYYTSHSPTSSGEIPSSLLCNSAIHYTPISPHTQLCPYIYIYIYTYMCGIVIIIFIHHKLNSQRLI